MDAYEALVTRVSATELEEPGPDEAEEAKILAAALRAPDHGRLRPTRFVSIRGETRARFGEILAEALKRRNPRATPDLIERERQKAFRSPLIIVVAARFVSNVKIPAVEQLLSAGAAAQNVLIACHALGFGAVWKTGDAAYDDSVKEALGLKTSDAIVAFLYIGTSKSPPLSQTAVNPSDIIIRL